MADCLSDDRPGLIKGLCSSCCGACGAGIPEDLFGLSDKEALKALVRAEALG